MERQYIGARYVPVFANPIEWDNQRSFEALTVVNYMGASYTSKKAVPAGTKPTDTKYWACTGNYNAQVEEYRQAAQRAVDVFGAIEKELPVAENSRWVTVGGKGCNFKTINEAINAVKGYATNTNRITVFITAGTYNEEIRLLPNPGIDFVGVGRVKVQYPSVYPNAPVFMSGKANIENIEFLCLESETPSYAVHIEAQADATETELKFKNCVFESNSGYAAMGVGLGEGYNIECRGCRFVSTENAALFLHNNKNGHANNALMRCYNCDFYGLSGTDVEVHNTRVMEGGVGRSQVDLSFANCVGNTGKVSYNDGVDTHHYIPYGSEFILEATSKTEILGLDRHNRYLYVGWMGENIDNAVIIPVVNANRYEPVKVRVYDAYTNTLDSDWDAHMYQGYVKLLRRDTTDGPSKVRVEVEAVPL